MERLHTSTVTPDQIDHLGHMNVRFYGELACVGASSLAGSLGLRSGGGSLVVGRDIHVRHHREQLEGARLSVCGGVVDACSERIRLYEELVNDDSGELAATFVVSLEAPGDGDQPAGTLSAEQVERARLRVVEVPEHGRPRSIMIEDDPVAGAPRLGELSDRGLATCQVREIDADERDRAAWFDTGRLIDLVWGGQPVDGTEFQPFHRGADGRIIAWATMETRGTWNRLPQAGELVQSFGAELELAGKTMRSRHWVFEVERGDLVCMLTTVNLAFDFERRCAVSIPDELRDSLAARLHPDLDSASPAEPRKLGGSSRHPEG